VAQATGIGSRKYHPPRQVAAEFRRPSGAHPREWCCAFPVACATGYHATALPGLLPPALKRWAIVVKRHRAFARCSLRAKLDSRSRSLKLRATMTADLQSPLHALFRGPRPLRLQHLQIPPTLRVAVLAPHPDDFDAIAVTLRHFRDNGNRIAVAVATGGASGVEDVFPGAVDDAAKIRLREAEQRASCRLFGLPEERLHFLRLVEGADGHPLDTADNFACVRAWLVAQQPDLVFLPHGNDTNDGHRRLYAFFRQSAEVEKLTLVACLNRDPKTIAMRDDLVTAFGAEEAAWKGALLRCHQTQHQRNLHTRGHGFDDRILNVNRQFAKALGCGAEYAETFELDWQTPGLPPPPARP